jgi:hypothetical protein
VIIMIAATTISLVQGGVPMAALPCVTGLLTAFVVYGRYRLAPQDGTSGRSSMETAAC